MEAVFKPGLYAITPQRHPDLRRLLAEVRLALEGGAAMIQFRDKSRDFDWRRKAASELCELCSSFEAPFIVNDDVKLAVEVGASGVHIGREDIETAVARRVLGQKGLLGVSCYNDLGLANRACGEGADYLAFGSVFPSLSKPEAKSCSTAVFARARKLGKPLVAIGGITADNGQSVIAAGADSLAVISAVFDASDVRAAAAAFSRIWQNL